MRESQYEDALAFSENLLGAARLQNNLDDEANLTQLQQFLRQRLQVNPYRVGVLLPLTSSIPTAARLTQQTIEGLRLALQNAPALEHPAPPDLLLDNATTSTEGASQGGGQISDNQTAPIAQGPAILPAFPRWEFVFRDTRLDPEVTRQGFRELVEQEKVVAVIGPLTRRTSEAAAEEAEALQVPMISLSLTTSIADLGDYVFRNNLSWEQEVAALLDYSTQYLQARRFVVLYPDSREGREKLKVFWERARHVGARVQNIQRYESQQSSYVDEFESFTGIRRFRTDEEDALIAAQRDRGEPQRNFDAIFLIAGDQTQDLEIIFPYLEVYGLENSLILGDSGWNNPLLLFAPKHETIRRAVFTDSFFPQSEASEVQRFVAQHERFFYRYQNYIGPTAYTAYAYDTARLLLELLEQPENHDPSILREALLGMPPTEGVTGRFHFQPNGEVRHQMSFWTLGRDRFTPLSLPSVEE